jgi:cytochrome c peroxidase
MGEAMPIKSVRGFVVVLCAGALVGLFATNRSTADDNDLSLTFNDASGQISTVDVTGDLDSNNPFFQELGVNGRTCFSCHRPAQGWTITPQSVRARFAATAGLDPIFRPNDGSNCEGADVSTLPRRIAAFSLLLTRGLIRIGIDVPAGAEFAIESVDDPYRCEAPLTRASMYRRPLPSTNLRFLSAVMWDGRESSPTTTILQDLAKQADDATTGHAEASLHLTPAEARQIVAFETGLFTAQRRDNLAGALTAAGALGGPVNLSQQPFFIGINDPVGLNPTGAPFDPRAFSIFNAWASFSDDRRDVARARAAIARGQEIFNTKPIVIQGVAGLNNETFPNGVSVPDPFTGSCTTCHDAPNAGDHSVKAPLNIGLTDASRRTQDMPLYTLRRLSVAGERVQTTDPGRAMITGKWADIGKFKGPVLRGLAARAPYFHNGSAVTLMDVVEFYESRFNIGLTAQEKGDLVAFLLAL